MSETLLSLLSEAPERLGAFALLVRTGDTRVPILEIYTGDMLSVSSLSEVPLPPPGQHRNFAIAVVPYRQLVEREFACVDDEEPLRILRIAYEEKVPLETAMSQWPDAPVGISEGRFDVDDDAYADRVSEIVTNEIGSGAGSNFVLKRTFHAELTSYSLTTALTAFGRLVRRESGAYWTFLVHTGERTWVGASPERHISLDAGVATMNPISGTYRYQYMLYQGGATNANDWYLRSQFDAPATPKDTTDPTTGAPNTASASTRPVALRPAVVGYSVTPLLNAGYGFTILGRLHERVGDIASLDAAQPTHSNGVWGRISGQNLDADAGDRFSADERTFFAQFGKDWTLSRGANGGSTHAGATLTFGSTSASFSDSARSIAGLADSTGTVETQAQSIGGYWTKYLPDGSYFDGVGQLTHYQNRYGDIFGSSGSQNGFGAGVSGEVGKPFALGSTGVAIEPQAQLLYQYLHLNQFDDGISPVGSNTTNGLRGRLGFRLFRANLGNDLKTSSVTPYFTADVLHDFFSPGQVTLGGTSLGNELGKTWYDVGVGITGNFARNSDLYANVKYEHSMGGEYRRNVFGQVGYRFSW